MTHNYLVPPPPPHTHTSHPLLTIPPPRTPLLVCVTAIPVLTCYYMFSNTLAQTKKGKKRNPHRVRNLHDVCLHVYVCVIPLGVFDTCRSIWDKMAEKTPFRHSFPAFFQKKKKVSGTRRHFSAPPLVSMETLTSHYINLHPPVDRPLHAVASHYQALEPRISQF